MRLLLTIAVAALTGWFWFDNRQLLSQTVELVFRLPYLELRPFPPQGPRLDILLILSFLAGFVLAYLLGIVRRVQSVAQVRRLRRELKAQASTQPITPAPTQE